MPRWSRVYKMYELVLAISRLPQFEAAVASKRYM